MLVTDTLWGLVDERAEATPDAQMLVDMDGRELTFAAYRDAAEEMAAGLADLGIGEGDVVSWELPTTVEAITLVGALARLGAVQNPIIPIYREREVGFIAKQARPKLLIVPRELRGFDFEAMAAKIASDVDGLAVHVADPDIPTADASNLPAFAGNGEEVRWLFYTSGTTADPKGAQHTDVTVTAAARGMAERLELAPEDRNALVFPFTHIGGIIWLFSGLSVGLTQLVVPAFDPATTIPFLKEQHVTIAGAGTPFHMAYLTAQRESDEKLFEHVRIFPGGGAPKPPQLHHDVKAELGGAGIVSGYGLTEAPIITMASASDGDESLANTEGRPMAGVDLRVVDLDGNVVGTGEEGEIRAKAPQVMKGYLDASLDEEGFDDEGYFRTGDLGYLDEDGCVVITGRTKDIIIRKGENISAKEIEDLLHAHDSVADVAVIGLPDPSSGERACAVVVQAEGAELSFKEMQRHLEAAGLRKQAIPEQLEVVDELPRNPAGKILKQDLKERFGR